MPDIFGYNRSPKPANVFNSERSLLTLSGGINGAVAGALIQAWSCDYQQQVNEVFELGSSNIYWLKGRPVGSAQIQRIVGPSQLLTDMIDPNGFDLCDGGIRLEITSATGLCGEGGEGRQTRLSMDGAVVVGVNYKAQATDSMVFEGVALRFALLEVA